MRFLGGSKAGAEKEEETKVVTEVEDEGWTEVAGPVAVLKSSFPSVPEHEIRNFLEYHQGKLEPARDTLKACLKWREENLPIDPEAVRGPREAGLFYFHGRDKEGRPLAYFSLKEKKGGKRDIEQHIKAVVFESERMVERNEGNSDYHITILVNRRDVTGLGPGDLDMFKAFFKTFATLYPMKLYRVIIYPTAAVTRMLWTLLRPFLHTHVQKKLVLATSFEEVQQYVSKDQLITSVGGDDPYDYHDDL